MLRVLGSTVPSLTLQHRRSTGARLRRIENFIPLDNEITLEPRAMIAGIKTSFIPLDTRPCFSAGKTQFTVFLAPLTLWMMPPNYICSFTNRCEMMERGSVWINMTTNHGCRLNCTHLCSSMTLCTSDIKDYVYPCKSRRGVDKWNPSCHEWIKRVHGRSVVKQ